jgi:hypothetical protein
MKDIAQTIEEIFSLFIKRTYLSIMCDARKKGDTVDVFIARIVSEELELIRTNEEALRKELELEVLAAMALGRLERIELYLKGPRWVVAMRLCELTN